MPEGHVLHRLAGMVEDAFVGQRCAVSSPQGRFGAAAELDGELIVGGKAVGKNLFIEFDHDRVIHIHLGLIGTLDFGGPPLEPPRGQVRLRIVAPNQRFADLRGAMRCELIDREERTRIVAKLGPDPLDGEADSTAAWRRIRASRRAIGLLLLEQSILSGVGNVYRAEVLFRYGMHPTRPGNTLTKTDFDHLWADLVDLMGAGVISGRIDTVRLEHTPEAMGRAPREDDHGGEVYVYRRAGKPCYVCSETIVVDKLGGRNSFWCPGCQPLN